MEAHFYLSPLIEPIGRKSFLKKWTDHKSAYIGAKKSQCWQQFNDIYRFLFQILEQENLELAYQFRYTVETAGPDVFIERLDQLDRALKRAKNNSFKPLERLLQKIQIDLGLDSDQPTSTLTFRRSIVRDAISLDVEYEDTILPFIPDPTTSDNTDHHIPFGHFKWQQNPEDFAEQPEEEGVIASSEMKPYNRFSPSDGIKPINDLPIAENDKQNKNELIPKLPGFSTEHSELSEENLVSESQPSLDTQFKPKADLQEKLNAPPNIEPSAPSFDPIIINKGLLDQKTSQIQSSDPPLAKAENAIITDKKASPSKQDLTDNQQDATPEPMPEESIPELTAEAKKSSETPKDYFQITPINDEETQNLEFETEFEAAIDNEGSESPDNSKENSSHREQSVATPKGPILPLDKSPLPLKKANKEKQSIQHHLVQPSSLMSKKTAKSSNSETVKPNNTIKDQDLTVHIESNEKNEQAEHFFERSDALKLYYAAKSESSPKDHSEEKEEKPTEPSSHRSLSQSSNQGAPRAVDRSFMRSLKSPVRKLKVKFGINDNHVAPLPTPEPEEEHHPNLPKISKKKVSLPFKVRNRSIPASEEKIEETAEEVAHGVNKVDYNLANFKLPAGLKEGDQDGKLHKNGSASESEETPGTSIHVGRNGADLGAKPAYIRKSTIARINKQKESGINGEQQNRKATEKTESTHQPPPLYKFKFKLKKSSIHQSREVHDHGTSLLIFKDCIERRSTTAANKKHFLAGSSTWNYFHKKDSHPFYRDTTSLVIQKDCIEHRILHNPLPAKHALQMSSSELETFKAFDAHFSNTGDSGEEKYFVDDYDSSFNGTDDFSFYDPYGDENYNKTIYEKRRKELYQTCINRLNQKDELFFDYKAGKITIDNTDKHEIEKWVRSQLSQSTEIYRAYAEAIMHPSVQSMKAIQELVRSKLQGSDFPSQRVKDIFDKLKEKSPMTELKQNDLIGILKRQDYVSVDTNSLSSTISFSKSYSRYRAWRNTVESPNIEVRSVKSGESQPIIPFESFSRRLNYLDTPKINVRSSSDYQFKKTLPVFDKIFSWRKTHS